MSSTGKRPPKTSVVSGADPADVRSLYEKCFANEKGLSEERVLKRLLVRQLAFGGKDFAAFSGPPPISSATESELAAKYRLLVEKFRDATSAEERLRLFATWLWAELGMPPEDSLGEKTAKRLSSKAVRRVNTIPWNDYYLAELVQNWLPYGERLLEDARKARAGSGNEEQALQTLGYNPQAINVFLNSHKSWRSAIEFTCEWLATRGGIRMAKPRKDPDLARTLRNAYSRMFGRQQRRLFEHIF